MENNTLFIGKVTHCFNELASTNAYATDVLSKTKPSEGTAIIAGHQTAGRGQIGRSWFDTPGCSVLMSVILYPRWLDARAQFGLSQAAALAVADAVRPYAPAQVKWPNDVYVGDTKIAGILIQNSLSGSQIQWSVVGIGLNVNEADFPPELPRATSLLRIGGQTIPLDDIRQRLFLHLEQRYLQLKTNTERLATDYFANLYRYGSWHTYSHPATSQPFAGKIVGTDPSGRLGILMEDETVRYFDIKEVVFE